MFKVLFITKHIGVAGGNALHTVIASFDTKEAADIAASRASSADGVKAVKLY